MAVTTGYRLDVRFRDGTDGIVDMSAMVESEAAGVFAALRDRSVFEAVYVEAGAVTWPGNIDLAPDSLYAEIKARGRCVFSSDGLLGGTCANS
ncbi:DUF2442 domain-containing protein [Dyella mobilis]|uniref:DUF2442 domain-containing protein n=1 Tax=Dyella mobilis TaxID=1849582 RepID=UPI0019594411|nr:DUF2442 domain-containing protein [Dyella mobilis]